jgi:glycosyltransferase involved in cell wall biosynthesis
VRILLVTHYWPPEYGPDPPILHETALHLRALGAEVEVVAALPSYPTGRVPAPYRNRVLMHEETGGIPTTRSWTLSAPRERPLGRFANEISFDVSCLLASIRAKRPYDYVLAVTPPLTLIPSAWLLSKLLGSRYGLWVMDLHPEAAVSAGYIRGRHTAALLGRLARFGYRRASVIIAASEDCRRGILARGTAPDKVHFVPNGIDTELFRPVNACLRRDPGHLLAVYAGSMSHAHDLDSILGAARSLQREGDTSWRFLFVGAGLKQQALRRAVIGLGLRNVSVQDPVSRDQLPALLATADVVLVTFRDIAITRGMIPTKLYDAMSCGRPVILGMSGEARRIVEDADAGIVIPPEDPEELLAALRNLQASPARRARMGENGRRYAIEHFARDRLARRIRDLLA